MIFRHLGRDRRAVPKHLTPYRVFIASPGGLDHERRCFGRRLVTFTAQHAEHRGVVFPPLGWGDAIGGVGRPQELIKAVYDELLSCFGAASERALREEVEKARSLRQLLAAKPGPAPRRR